MQKIKLDREVDRLCAIDGGVHIYETAFLLRISSAGIGAAGARSANGRNDGGALGVGLSPTGVGPRRSAVSAREALASASITHLRTMFALRPLANATAAIDTPGCRHACTTCSLNSGACRRRVRLLGNSIPEVSMCPR